MEVEIGKRIFSDLASMLAVWHLHQKVGMGRWRLDNFLLTVRGVREQVLAEMIKCFQYNDDMVDIIIVWETFKAHMRGFLISFKAWRQKDRAKHRNTLMKN